jgi:starvation-inducible DNA-binding protein
VAISHLKKGGYMGIILNNGHNAKLQVPIHLASAPDNDAHHAVVEILNNTLANEALLTMKVRSAHWNVSGAGFLELHVLYKTQYKQLNAIADEIAERACTLGGLPTGSFEGLLKKSRLEEQPGDVPNIMDLLSDHEASIRFLGEDAKKCSEEYKDESTGALLVNIQQRHEKMACILRAHIEPQLTRDERNLRQ